MKRLSIQLRLCRETPGRFEYEDTSRECRWVLDLPKYLIDLEGTRPPEFLRLELKS